VNKPPTVKQIAARQRNWRVRNLRALYSQAHQLTGHRREIALAAIDAELAGLGAETYAKRAADRIEIDAIPY
jgi:hypothetical protein